MGDEFFPYTSIRAGQQELLADVARVIAEKKHLVAHAPTGIGKTVSVLAPAVRAAMDSDAYVIFLTSRHTQHAMPLRTIADITQACGRDIPATSIIGRQNLCCQPGAQAMPSSDFYAFCKSLREDEKCEHYVRARVQQSIKLDIVLHDLSRTATTTEKMMERGQEETLCPYELALMLAEKAKLIITDYSYLFHPGIRESFLAKTRKSLNNAIVVVDEGHNLPERLRELFTQRITTRQLEIAAREAKKFGHADLGVILEEISAALFRLVAAEGEKLVTREAVIEEITRAHPLDAVLQALAAAADSIREQQQRTALGPVAEFLSGWADGEEGFARIITRTRDRQGNPVVQLTKRCLDPGLALQDVIGETHSTIVMSGTLAPPAMYAALLGFPPERTLVQEYASPFPRENRSVVIVPSITTRYRDRSEDQYKKTAQVCADITNALPGCSAVFFPSYQYLESVYAHLSAMRTKTLLCESRKESKEERENKLRTLATYRDNGAVLLGVASGSFGEGIDLKNNLLKGILVVGIPLNPPDLETEQLTKYYDRKFGAGIDYGYYLPALTKTVQNAGRGIRNETDKCIIFLLDKRFLLGTYKKYLPRDWNPCVALDPVRNIKKFYGE